jgi:methylisocitrate lyase
VFTASEFEAMGYRNGDLAGERHACAAKVQEELYAAIKRDGGTHNMLSRMQTRKELYETIGYSEYESWTRRSLRACRRKGGR